ncbi:MAG TPA: tetratricopeptide repeat protein [Methylomirabilota bacterium]|jgi:tetratricopeptide (TPR) repeat protein|nr:tetratricopeptide repeat protein [Methylomirabilota bacterium]
MTALFSTREVAKIVELDEGRIRSCVSAGLLAPARGAGGRLRFTFQDLLLLRTTKGLLESRVPLPRIRRLLASLKRQLTGTEQLWNLMIYADGRRVVAWDGRARWQPDSGQFLFNFDVETFAAQAVPRRAVDAAPAALRKPPERVKATGAPALTAAQWFALASELETASPEEARRAYHQALALDPTLVDAHVNLGRLYHVSRRPAEAEAHYRAAIRHAPDDAVAHFNLGVLLEELARRSEAVGAYRQAIARDPRFADAHVNLGLLFESLGHRSEAIDHLRLARKLYGRRK